MRHKLSMIFVPLFFLSACAFAQHRGDNLAFQGLPLNQPLGAKSVAQGGAYTAQSGDLNSLFQNPAGLADIADFQITISAKSSANQWRENQVYRPNRMFWTLAFYLEGLYTPDPENNGRWDYELAQDSSYKVDTPILGLEPYSEAAADWRHEVKQSGFDHIAAAFPLHIMNQRVVAAAAYYHNAFFEYDRNDTYLDPHIGYDEYSVVQRVVNDTVRFSWSQFLSQRAGDMHNVTAGLAWDLSSRIKIGLAMEAMSGNSSDFQSLNRVGYFDIAKDNRFRFSYDTLDVAISGKSKYHSTRLNLGAAVKLEQLALGFNIKAPYTISRDRDYAAAISSGDSVLFSKGGADKFKHPATFSFGASLTPARQFQLSLDYHFTPYSQGEIELQTKDATNRKMPDQTDLRCGILFRPWSALSLMAGYRQMTALFVPDGAAIKDRGPAVTSYSLGASFQLFNLGTLDLAYEMNQLKYYDSYFSNTNYALELSNNMHLAYTMHF